MTMNEELHFTAYCKSPQLGEKPDVINWGPNAGPHSCSVLVVEARRISRHERQMICRIVP